MSEGNPNWDLKPNLNPTMNETPKRNPTNKAKLHQKDKPLMYKTINNHWKNYIKDKHELQQGQYISNKIWAFVKKITIETSES